MLKNTAVVGAKIALAYTQILQPLQLPNNISDTESLSSNHSQKISTSSTNNQSDRSKSTGKRIAIIGGAAIDIISKSDSLNQGSLNSHVGKIVMNVGGTTRNIAECLGRLGLGSNLTFVSNVGDDEFSVFVRNSLTSVGVSDEFLFVKESERTAAFTGLIDKNGDFFCGVADMTVLEYIPVAHLEKTKFWESSILVIDSNVGLETLQYILQKSYCKVKHIIYEPISQEKSERILYGDLLSKITILKPNLVQLVHLVEKILGQPIRGLKNVFAEDKAMIKKMIMKLVEYANEKNPKGNTLKQVILTLGKDGVYIFSTHGKGTFTHYLAREVDPKDIKSVVGAGDNFLAGYVFGMYHYQSEYNCVNFGQLCSELTLKSEKNVAPEINDKTLLIP